MADKKPAKAVSSEEYNKSYIKLRTVLDSLEILSLQYTLQDPKHSVRIKRANEIVQMLMPVIREIQTKGMLGDPPIQCPEGFHMCDDCCVPYQCP